MASPEEAAGLEEPRGRRSRRDTHLQAHTTQHRRRRNHELRKPQVRSPQRPQGARHARALGAAPGLVSLTIRDARGQAAIPVTLTTGLSSPTTAPSTSPRAMACSRSKAWRSTSRWRYGGGARVHRLVRSWSVCRDRHRDGRQFDPRGREDDRGGQCGALGMWVITPPGTSSRRRRFQGQKGRLPALPLEHHHLADLRDEEIRRDGS